MTSDPAAERLATAAATLGIDVAPTQVDALVRWVDALLDETTRVNLTAVKDREAALVLHALDGLALGLVRTLVDVPPRSILDLGTGNGFPGVCAAALWPDARVALVDRTAKKIAAIERIAERSGWRDRVTPLRADADQLPGLDPDRDEAHALVICRAVGPVARVAPAAERLLMPSGELVVWTSAEGIPELPARAGRQLERTEVVLYDLPAPAARARALAVYRRG